MAGAITKGSASIVSGEIVFTAPQTFEGFSEIGYRITDSNWNIDFLGTVKINASAGSTVINPVTPITVITPTPIVGIGNATSPILPTVLEFNKLIYLIIALGLLIGAIVYYSLKKVKWILGFIGLIVIGLGFAVYQFFKKK